MIQNRELGEKLLENIQTLNEAAFQLFDFIYDGDGSAEQFAQTMRQLINGMQEPLDALQREESALMAHLINNNLLHSLDNLMHFFGIDNEKACRKIQFELVPLTAELYNDLYFWGFCYPDKGKMHEYYQNDMNELCPLPMPEDGVYKYEVSVVIVAFNKLEYTMKCVEYFKKYFPHELNYELILFNNGSSDQTKEYFESLHPDKQIDLHNNTKSWSIVYRAAEGKYLFYISNDVLLLPNAAENMLKCIESDESICCVAPTCPNVANMQTIPASYGSEEEMVEFAKKNNISNPFCWEQRSRLNPPALLGRSSSAALGAMYSYLYMFSPERFLAFTDDLMGLVARRNGQKCFLAKDAYVHHYGSVTTRDEISGNSGQQTDFYTKGRMDFFKTFGIDPWGTGFCFDPELISALHYEFEKPVCILGVNCGMGDTPLKIKALLKERCHNNDVEIYNITDTACCKDDLAGLSDGFVFAVELGQVKNEFAGKRFEYVIADDISGRASIERLVDRLFTRVCTGGLLAVKNTDETLKPDRCSRTDKTEHWQIFYKS